MRLDVITIVQCVTRTAICAIWIWRYIAWLNFITAMYFNNIKKTEKFQWPCGLQDLEISWPTGHFHSIGYRATVKVEHWSYCSEIWQASQQHYYQGTCQIPEWLEKSKPKSRSFRDFTISCSKTCVHLVNRGPVLSQYFCLLMILTDFSSQYFVSC